MGLIKDTQNTYYTGNDFGSYQFTSLDDIIGHVNAFELFKKPKTIKSILLPIEIVPESMMISDVLNNLTRKRKSIAVVVDEYGGTSGMITVEDVVEELFGEIEDEHDVEDLLEEEINEGEYLFSARHAIDYSHLIPMFYGHDPFLQNPFHEFLVRLHNHHHTLLRL